VAQVFLGLVPYCPQPSHPLEVALPRRIRSRELGLHLVDPFRCLLPQFTKERLGVLNLCVASRAGLPLNMSTSFRTTRTA
jgi:hypothetical protein